MEFPITSAHTDSTKIKLSQHRKSMPSQGINLAAMAEWSNVEMDTAAKVAEKL